MSWLPRDVPIELPKAMQTVAIAQSSWSLGTLTLAATHEWSGAIVFGLLACVMGWSIHGITKPTVRAGVVARWVYVLVKAIGAAGLSVLAHESRICPGKECGLGELGIQLFRIGDPVAFADVGTTAVFIVCLDLLVVALDSCEKGGPPNAESTPTSG